MSIYPISANLDFNIKKIVKNLIADDSKTIEYEYFDLSLYVMENGELTPKK